jgi:hypothetical protein
MEKRSFKELTMLRKVLFSAMSAALAATATLAVSTNASATGRLADVTVIDRSTGETLPVHVYKGEYWVAGTPGAKYSVSVANAAGNRILAVMSVDGVNVLNGQTASVDQSGYVFNGYQRYEVTGWRKNNNEVAAFEFVASPASYAARTGRPANVGVIGVALFNERVYQPPVSVTPPYRYGPYGANKAESSRGAAADATTGLPPVGAAGAAPSPAASAAPAEMAKRYEPRADMREKLGTGHGEREWSQVTHTSFERAQSSPNETIRIRYDSRENLISMGVIPVPHRHGHRPPNPFPESLGYVPDPPRFWR